MKTVLCGLAVASMLMIGVMPSESQNEPFCWQCVPDGSGGMICSYPYYTGGFTCEQQSPTNCVLGDDCGIAGGCFLPGTLVETTDGLMPIEELVEGDRVMGREDIGPKYETVSRTYKAVGCGYYVINSEIRVTGTHPFYVEDRWVEAKDLKIGDRLSGKNGMVICIESIEKVNRAVRAYNIEVTGDHTFYVDGVLVHNKIDPPQG
jgi:hypothetical protein